MTEQDSSISTTLDEDSLNGENGEIYLFQWLASNERALSTTSFGDVKSSQNALQSILLDVVSGTKPKLVPGRPVRNLVAQCFVTIYARGETRTLYDTVQALLKVISEQKTAAQDGHRVAALYCIGELMQNFGAQVMSLMGEITTNCMKAYKSSNLIILRCHALVTLEKSLATAKRALTDSALKDVLKQSRNAIGDKALPIVRAGCKILTLLYPAGDGTRSVSEVESIVTLCVKHLETADQPTRSSLGKLAAHMLASTQVARTAPIVDTSKKGKKTEDNADDEDLSSPSHVVNTEAALIMPSNEMFQQLSTHFNKPQATQKTRIGIISFYVALIMNLGNSFVEQNYSLIVAHLMTDIVSHPRSTASRYEALLVRTLLNIVLRDLVGVRMLTEQGQISAIQEFSNAYLKRWPAMMPGQTAPSPLVLTIALEEVAGLLQQLGNAPPQVQEVLTDPLTSLLAHPNHTVRVNAAWTLRCFCYASPLRLPKTLLNLSETLQHDITSLSSPAAPSDIHLRALGHAYGLTALLSLIPHRPLYVSYDISANIFYISVQLLKNAGEHDVHIARVEVEIAWTMIASLMSLGPNFVKAHLPQLLVLWRNALPKPTSKDSSVDRSQSEWMFLLHVRETALRAIYCFLHHNSATLVTLDVTRRLTSLLGNALQFANVFASHNRIEPTLDSLPQSRPKGISLVDTEALLRLRIFNCFAALDLATINDSTQASLLQSSMSLFASPDGYIGSSVQAAIASSSGSFTNIWQSIDGYAYGVTDMQIANTPTDNATDWLNRDPIEAAFDELYRKPILRSLEHDPISLCQNPPTSPRASATDFPPPVTAAVNASISLFSSLLPLQDSTSMSRTVSNLLEATTSGKLDRNSGRKAAIMINASAAFVLTLRTVSSHSRQTSDALGSVQVASPMASFLKGMLVDGDPVLRHFSSEAIGRLASIGGTNFLTNQVKTLVNEVVENRDPHGRAGCALAFGAIYSHVGGLAAGPLLKTIVHVLMSLVNDPHPVVHFWALRALSQVIEAASLAYASHVPATLGLLFKTYMLESHEPEGGSLSHANLSGELPTYQSICQNIDALVAIVGPDIQESTHTRGLIMDLVSQLRREPDDGICVEAMKCVQHFLMFAPDHVEIPKLVAEFQGYLSSSRRTVKIASINALYQLVQKDALLMSRLGGDPLVEELFSLLDDDSSVEGVRNVITVWLKHTVVYNPSAWIDLCQRIMSRTTASQQLAEAANKRKDLPDDEGQSLSIASQESDSQLAGRSIAKWRTQLFSLQCLHMICTIIGNSGRREHIDLDYAQRQGLPTKVLLVSRVPDLIKIAFTASSANVMEIRLEGLQVLRDIIQTFAQSPDPDYQDVSLLEQYQAPITSALTPAFSADATPEILSSAIKACAVFVGSGIVKEISRMTRVIKLLTTGLEQCSESGLIRFGDITDLSPNASAMLRISILSAWADLKVASSSQSYLSTLIQTHQNELAVQWVTCLRDFATIKAGTDFDDAVAGSLDTSYASLGKDALLPFYLDSWPTMLHAIAISMQADDPGIQAAMDGRKSTINGQSQQSSQQRPTIEKTQQCTFFFVIFGLVFEALSLLVPDSETSLNNAVIALQCLRCLFQKQYAGDTLSDMSLFDEVISLLYRLALTGPLPLQIHLLDAVGSLHASLSTPSNSKLHTQCMQLGIYPIRRFILNNHENTGDLVTSAVKTKLIIAEFNLLVTISSTCDTATATQFYILGFAIYSELLKGETEEELIEPTLSCLKTLVSTSSSRIDPLLFSQVIHGFLSSCILNIDDMRGRQGSVCQKKIQSNLLAAVLILTVIPTTVNIGHAVIDYLCSLILQKLSELGEDISLTAVHCARTLISSSIMTGNPLLQLCGRILLPGMIEVLLKIASFTDDEHERKGGKGSSNRLLHVTNEILKTFNLILSSNESYQMQALTTFIPPMIFLLQPPTSSHTSPITQATITQLLSFASIAPSSFKEVASKLTNDQRTGLENALKQAVGGGGGKQYGHGNDSTKPQISLRSF
ncbi:clathrin-coated vesicle protein [Abortiporus biennis]|nr:clathrin-coated vesicle protein [Abortiporus biennis]